MKNIIAVLTVMFLSFSVYAQEAQDEQSVKVCKDLAQSQNLVDQEAKMYVDKCVKDIAEVEAEERKKAKS